MLEDRELSYRLGASASRDDRGRTKCTYYAIARGRVREMLKDSGQRLKLPLS